MKLIPDWLRWILVLPASGAASIAIQLVVAFGN